MQGLGNKDIYQLENLKGLEVKWREANLFELLLTPGDQQLPEIDRGLFAVDLRRDLRRPSSG